jgi:diguanylate cyclase (GGDEF)-like protein/PAS domain S-box-containing protein
VTASPATPSSVSRAPGRGLPSLVDEILEALPVAVLVVDAQQRVRQINLEAERLFGYRREELLGGPLDRLIPEAVRAAHAGWAGDFMDAPSARAMGVHRDLLAQRADKRLFPVEIALKPIRTDDGLFVIAAVLDLTARKALERRVLADKLELEQQVRERTAELERSIREQRAVVQCLETARAELERLTREDPLTGLANRREFDARLALEHERAVRHELPLSLAMLDLDFFKQVNDAFGHAVGDEVLRHVAAILRQQCRAVDLPARYGGEEFVIALPDTGLLEARLLCERVRRAVERHEWAAVHQGLAVTVSIGVAMRQDAETPPSLIEVADHCLYEAKRDGRNRVVARSGG